MKLIRKVVAPVLIGVFTLTQISTATYAASKTTIQTKVQTKKGIVTAKTLNVRKTASTKAKKLGTLKKNQSVIIYSSNKDWYQISYGKTKGWVASKYIKIVNKTKPRPLKNLNVNMDGLYDINLLGKTIYELSDLYIDKYPQGFRRLDLTQVDEVSYEAKDKYAKVTATYSFSDYITDDYSVIVYFDYIISSNSYTYQDWTNVFNANKNKLISKYGKCAYNKFDNSYYWNFKDKYIGIQLEKSSLDNKYRILVYMFLK